MQPPPYTTQNLPPGSYPQPVQGAYPQPVQGAYPPPGQPGYPAPPQGAWGPQYGQPHMVQPGHSQVIVVGQPAVPPPQPVVVKQRNGTNHLLHCIITFFFWPWVIVWIIFCILEDN